jgi:hypothetical protein
MAIVGRKRTVIPIAGSVRFGNTEAFEGPLVMVWLRLVVVDGVGCPGRLCENETSW